MSGKITNIVDFGSRNIGKGIYVKFENGMTGIYGHLSGFNSDLKIGDKVDAGQLLGFSGNSGNVVGKNGGYHLHFGLKDANGQFINPEPYAPLIQNMEKLGNVNITEISNKIPEIEKLDAADIFSKAMDSMTEMKINLINLLPDFYEVILILHSIVLSIF